MSRGGRGGRGGGRGGLSSAARLNSGAVPFDIDEELEKEFAKQKEDTDSFFPVSYPPILLPSPSALNTQPRRDTTYVSLFTLFYCFSPIIHALRFPSRRQARPSH